MNQLVDHKSINHRFVNQNVDHRFTDHRFINERVNQKFVNQRIKQRFINQRVNHSIIGKRYLEFLRVHYLTQDRHIGCTEVNSYLLWYRSVFISLQCFYFSLEDSGMRLAGVLFRYTDCTVYYPIFHSRTWDTCTWDASYHDTKRIFCFSWRSFPFYYSV